ncbi:MAG: hypothetical protein NZ555_14645 [Geminicoccaceae bacterium]|nr:hypothetical protein [Geminicoccaceae bacterium]MCX8101336.1 hypothetical protein [Geminicoccaceae bacterium]MDW8370984.1 hypothetical protein [Geminicoccaceae bacterium]
MNDRAPRAALLLLLGATTALAAGCAPPRSAPPPVYGREPVERGYLPPAEPPPPPPPVEVALAPEAAIAALAETLAGEERRVRRGSEADGTAWLALTSSGDPEPFVDCGSFELLTADGSSSRIPAARLAARIPLQPVERREVLLRQLRLDGRLLLTAAPTATGSRLEAKASYVLTRTVDRVALDGRVLDSQRETIAFETGGLGRFAQGMVCRPTGRLEAAIAAALERLRSEGDATGDAAPGADRTPPP